MIEWTEEQLKVVLISSMEADGGCCHCISRVLTRFFDLAGFDLIPRMEKISSTLDSNRGYTWEDYKPKWESWLEKKPNDKRYYCD